MKLKITIIPAVAIWLTIGSVVALAQTGQPIPSAIGAHVLPNTPAAMATPGNMSGGLYLASD